MRITLCAQVIQELERAERQGDMATLHEIAALRDFLVSPPAAARLYGALAQVASQVGEQQATPREQPPGVKPGPVTPPVPPPPTPASPPVDSGAGAPADLQDSDDSTTPDEATKSTSKKSKNKTTNKTSKSKKKSEPEIKPENKVDESTPETEPLFADNKSAKEIPELNEDKKESKEKPEVKGSNGCDKITGLYVEHYYDIYHRIINPVMLWDKTDQEYIDEINAVIEASGTYNELVRSDIVQLQRQYLEAGFENRSANAGEMALSIIQKGISEAKIQLTSAPDTGEVEKRAQKAVKMPKKGNSDDANQDKNTPPEKNTEEEPKKLDPVKDILAADLDAIEIQNFRPPNPLNPDEEDTTKDYLANEGDYTCDDENCGHKRLILRIPAPRSGPKTPVSYRCPQCKRGERYLEDTSEIADLTAAYPIVDYTDFLKPQAKQPEEPKKKASKKKKTGGKKKTAPKKDDRPPAEELPNDLDGVAPSQEAEAYLDEILGRTESPVDDAAFAEVMRSASSHWDDNKLVKEYERVTGQTFEGELTDERREQLRVAVAAAINGGEV